MSNSQLQGIAGPYWAGRNWSADEGEGSIHDDATAEKLGFRGGTVAGDVHMNQFPPVLLRVFGDAWFRTGNLSLMFQNATIDREHVRVLAEPLAPGATQTRVWMERDDGLVVCSGTAAVGDHSRSALRVRDLRPCDPADLRILRRVHAGMPLGRWNLRLTADKQFERFDAGLISDPIEAWRRDIGWGGVIAAPSTFVQYFWGPPTEALRPQVGAAVGLFGAIEIGHVDGPLLLDRDYAIESEVVCVGQSPQTEYLWFDTRAARPDGSSVATFRMMLRFMKASSPEYA